jgi:hypothetical protein
MSTAAVAGNYGTVFSSHNKLVNNIFQLSFSAKRTWICMFNLLLILFASAPTKPELTITTSSEPSLSEFIPVEVGRQ